MEKSPSNLFQQINNKIKRGGFCGKTGVAFSWKSFPTGTRTRNSRTKPGSPLRRCKYRLVGSSLGSAEGSLCMVDTEVLNADAQGACDGGMVEYKHE